MKYVRILLKATLTFISAIIIIIGLYLAIAGALNGLGHDSTVSKIEISAGGVGLVVIGFYLLYLANDRNLSKMFDDIINAIFRSF